MSSGPARTTIAAPSASSIGLLPLARCAPGTVISMLPRPSVPISILGRSPICIPCGLFLPCCFAWGSNDRPRLRNPAVCTHPSCGRVPHAILRADFRLLSLILPRNPFRLPALYHEQSHRVLAEWPSPSVPTPHLH